MPVAPAKSGIRIRLEVLKQELSALDANEQRQLTEKIDRPASEFATLEDLERRLGLSAH